MTYQPPLPGVDNDKRFFCFRGYMKSGTNWVGSLLNLHPQISCVGEFHWQTYYEKLQKDLRQLPIMSNAKTRVALRRHLDGLIRRVLVDVSKPTATVIGDRNPFTLNPIVIKDSSQITLMRDGRDVLISRIFHIFNFPEVATIFDRAPDLKIRLEKFREDPWYFRDHPDQLLANEELVRLSLRWWREHLESDRRTIAQHPGLRVLSLRYEDFHADVEANRNKMYEFLGVDAKVANPVSDHLMPVLKEERPNEFFRKGQIGDWKNYMTPEAKQWINEEAGEELIRNGYIPSLDW